MEKNPRKAQETDKVADIHWFTPKNHTKINLKTIVC